eukprot:7120118-Pyramimonas_sp.AAC.1
MHDRTGDGGPGGLWPAPAWCQLLLVTVWVLRGLATVSSISACVALGARRLLSPTWTSLSTCATG